MANTLDDFAFSELAERYTGAPGGEAQFRSREQAQQPRGAPMVQNIGQLLKLSQLLKDLPEQITAPIFSRLTGMPMKTSRESNLENAITQMMMRRQLEAPEREERKGERKEAQQFREEGRQQTQEFREENLGLRREAAGRQEEAGLKNLREAIAQARLSQDPDERAMAPALAKEYIRRLLGTYTGQGREGKAPAKKSKTTVRRID